MADGKDGKATTAGYTGLAGAVVALVGFLALVLSNIQTIVETADKLLGRGGGPPKLSLGAVRLEDPWVIGHWDLDINHAPSNYEFRDTPPTEQELKGRVLIDLTLIDQGLDAATLVPKKAPVVSVPLKIIGPNGDERSVPMDEGGTRVAEIFLRVIARSAGAKRYLIFDPTVDAAAAGGSGPRAFVLRAAIMKETSGRITDCRFRLERPDGSIQTTFNAVELPKGTGADFYEFGIAFADVRPTDTVTAVLHCANDGVTAGAGPVPVTIAPDAAAMTQGTLRP